MELDEAERSLLSSSAGRGVKIAMANGDPIVILLLAMLPFAMVVILVILDEVDGAGMYGRRSNVLTLLLSSSLLSSSSSMSSVVSALFHFPFHLPFHLSFRFGRALLLLFLRRSKIFDSVARRAMLIMMGDRRSFFLSR